MKIPAGHITSNGYRRLYLPKHPLACKSNGLVYAHRVVLYEAIGGGAHLCRWCCALVRWEAIWPRDTDALIVDHFDRDRLNNDPSNLVPACHPCNRDRRRARDEGN